MDLEQLKYVLTKLIVETVDRKWEAFGREDAAMESAFQHILDLYRLERIICRN